MLNTFVRTTHIALALGFCVYGCAKAGVVGDSTGKGSGGNTSAPTGGSPSVITLDPTLGGSIVAPAGDGEIVQSKEECDGGTGCICPPFNVAVIGKPGKWGAVQGGDPPTALMDWLNSSSAGTAKVSNFTDRPTLTAAMLADYNAIILGSLSDDSDRGPWWTFTDAEVAAFRAWLENGGGVIGLTGYSSGTDEIKPVNQLVGFSGVAFNPDDVYASCTDWGICTCTKSMLLSTWVTTDPAIANLTSNLTLIGYEHGRSVAAPADAHVAATLDGTKNVLVGKVVGKGRVLLYGDEWITYTSQWTGEGNPMAKDPGCKGNLPQDRYQTAQLWYNMIKWSAPAATCFKIVDKTNPVKIW